MIAHGQHAFAGEHLPQDALDLEQCEVPAEAVLAPSPPWQPCARLLRFSDEALWSELLGLGVELGVVVHEVGAGREMDSRTVGPPADLDRLHDLSRDREEGKAARR